MAEFHPGVVGGPGITKRSTKRHAQTKSDSPPGITASPRRPSDGDLLPLLLLLGDDSTSRWAVRFLLKVPTRKGEENCVNEPKVRTQ